jgi:hypothetical protein
MWSWGRDNDRDNERKRRRSPLRAARYGGQAGIMIGTTIGKAGVDADSAAFGPSARIVSLRILVPIVVSIVVEVSLS